MFMDKIFVYISVCISFGCSKFAGYITNTQQLFDEHCDTTHFESSLTDEDSDLYLSCGSDQVSLTVYHNEVENFSRALKFVHAVHFKFFDIYFL